MKLNIFPEDEVLIGDEIIIKADDCSEGIIHVRRKYFDGDVDYSYAKFEGEIDTLNSAPKEGFYTGVDVSGLFWSQVSTQFNDILPDHLNEIDDKHCGHYIIDLEVENIIVDTKYLLIKDVSDEVKSIDVSSGRVRGKIFYKEKSAPQGILIHVAAEDGIQGTEANAKLLASKGFATFALPHYKYLDLPIKSDEIPLEYFYEAIKLLDNYEFIDTDNIGIIGYTRGAELALLLASKYKEIKYCIASNPSCVVNQSIDSQYSKPKSSWILNNNPLNFSKIKKNELFKIYLNQLFRGKKELIIKSIYNIPDKCEIDVENINGDILLLTVEDDCRWDSILMSNLIKNRLNDNSFGFKFQLVQYKNAGQVIGGPGFLPTSSYNDLRFLLGGTSQGNGIAQNESWKKIIEFLSERN